MIEIALRQAKTLEAFGNPKDHPKWLTPKHVAKCMENRAAISKAWKPEVGDWYFCQDLCRIIKIETIAGYFYDPAPGSPGSLSSDSHVTNGKWPCDTYIPNPTKLRKILSQKK